MAYKIFLDDNIILDYALKRENYKDAKATMQLVENNSVQGFITSSVLHITGYWMAKAYGSDNTKLLLLNLLTDVTVIDIPHKIALIALNSKINDIEDALQYYTAIHHKLNCFISRDKQLKKDGIPALPVYTPHEFLNMVL